VTAALTPAGEVKRKKLRQEIRVKPDATSIGYRETTDKWYVVDVFDNEVVDTDDNLLIVGSEESNELLRHLGRDGTFAYDKVLEKITAKFPGPGRGIIGTVECINSPTYDPRSQSRDAIVVGGSDAAGTTAAVNELAGLIGQYCRDLPPPIAPRPKRLGAAAATAGSAPATAATGASP
jgi:hypothetical protein